jgi:hypothetical protein
MNRIILLFLIYFSNPLIAQEANDLDQSINEPCIKIITLDSAELFVQIVDETMRELCYKNCSERDSVITWILKKDCLLIQDARYTKRRQRKETRTKRTTGLDPGLFYQIDFGAHPKLADVFVSKLNVSTTIGYQLSRNFAVGISTGVDFTCSDVTFIPVLFNMRFSLLKQKTVPFLEIRNGYSFTTNKDFYGYHGGYKIVAKLGLLIKLNESIRFRAGVLYTRQQSYYSYKDCHIVNGTGTNPMTPAIYGCGVSRHEYVDHSIGLFIGILF